MRQAGGDRPVSGYGQRASCHALRIGDEQGIAERARDHDGDCQVRLGWSDIGDTRGPGQSGGVSGYRFRLPEIFSQLQGGRKMEFATSVNSRVTSRHLKPNTLNSIVFQT